MFIVFQSQGQENENQTYKKQFIQAIKQKTLGNNEEAIKQFNKCIELNTKESAAFYELSIIYKNQNNLELAKKNAKLAAKLNQTNKWYKINYAEILFYKQDFSEAIIQYKKLINQESKKKEYYFMLIDAYVAKKEYKKAIETYDKIENNFGEDKKLYIQKHKLYLILGETEKSINEIEKLCAKFPKDIEAVEILADLYFLNDKTKQAIILLKRIITLDSKNGRAHIRLARYYSLKKDQEKKQYHLTKAFYSKKLSSYEKIKTLYNELEELEKKTKHQHDTIKTKKQKNHAIKLCKLVVDMYEENAEAHAIFGHFLYREKQYKEAEQEYKKSLEIEANNTDVWTHLLFLQTKENNFDKLLKTSREALSFFPTEPLYYYYYGISNYQLKKYKEAAEVFEMGLEFVLEDNIFLPDFYSSLGDSYHAIEEHEKSDFFYEKSLEEEPENPIVLNNYSYYLSLRKKDLLKAKNMSKKSNTIEPNNGTYQDTYAWILYQSGEYEEAKQWIEKALKNGSKDSPVVVEHYGDILYKLNNIQEAVFQWKKAKKMGLGSKFLDKKIKELKLYE